MDSGVLVINLKSFPLREIWSKMWKYYDSLSLEQKINAMMMLDHAQKNLDFYEDLKKHIDPSVFDHMGTFKEHGTCHAYAIDTIYIDIDDYCLARYISDSIDSEKVFHINLDMDTVYVYFEDIFIDKAIGHVLEKTRPFFDDIASVAMFSATKNVLRLLKYYNISSCQKVVRSCFVAEEMEHLGDCKKEIASFINLYGGYFKEFAEDMGSFL